MLYLTYIFNQQKGIIMKKTLFSTLLASTILIGATANANEIKLSEPDLSSSLMKTIDTRKTSRAFSTEKLKPQDLSNVLWAAFGTNSHSTRTIATGKNEQDLTVFVIYEGKVWLYDGKKHVLNFYSDVDLMPYIDKQDFVKDAPVHLIYAGGKHYAEAHSGSAYQNVYLYAAENSLATVIRGYIDKEGLNKALNLPENQTVTYHQPIGYPAK